MPPESRAYFIGVGAGITVAAPIGALFGYDPAVFATTFGVIIVAVFLYVKPHHE